MFFLTKNVAAIVVARAIQGISAAIVWISGQSILILFLGEDGIASGMGFINAGISSGELTGPLIGGIVYAQAGHYALFAVATSVIALDFILRLALKYPDTGETNSRVETSAEAAESDALIDHETSNQPTGAKPNHPKLGRFIHFSQQKEYLTNLGLTMVGSTVRTAFESVSPLVLSTNALAKRRPEFSHLYRKPFWLVQHGGWIELSILDRTKYCLTGFCSYHKISWSSLAVRGSLHHTRFNVSDLGVCAGQYQCDESRILRLPINLRSRHGSHYKCTDRRSSSSCIVLREKLQKTQRHFLCDGSS